MSNNAMQIGMLLDLLDREWEQVVRPALARRLQLYCDEIRDLKGAHDAEKAPHFDTPLPGSAGVEEVPLPCPFCGKYPTTRPWREHGQQMRLVSCDNDEGCSVQPSVTGKTPSEAIARWNRRFRTAEAPQTLGKENS